MKSIGCNDILQNRSVSMDGVVSRGASGTKESRHGSRVWPGSGDPSLLHSLSDSLPIDTVALLSSSHPPHALRSNPS